MRVLTGHHPNSHENHANHLNGIAAEPRTMTNSVFFALRRDCERYGVSTRLIPCRRSLMGALLPFGPDAIWRMSAKGRWRWLQTNGSTP